MVGTAYLSQEAEVGLFGEMVVLKALLEAGVPVEVVLNAWQGPLDGLHDFLIGSGAIEVKTTLSTNGFPATVNSLEQLDESLQATTVCRRGAADARPWWLDTS